MRPKNVSEGRVTDIVLELEVKYGKWLLEKNENTIDGESVDNRETDKDVNSCDSLQIMEG
jgi:hypothetical protein